MTLRSEAEEEAKSPDPEPSVVRRGGRKRKHEDVRIFHLFIYSYLQTEAT